jgi:DNA-binding CsgD family transcriptional regulator
MENNTKVNPLSRLSERELQVMKLVVEGKTSKEIAAIVGVKPTSIQTYRSRIMAKLETTTIVDLVRLAIRRGLITP